MLDGKLLRNDWPVGGDGPVRGGPIFRRSGYGLRRLRRGKLLRNVGPVSNDGPVRGGSVLGDLGDGLHRVQRGDVPERRWGECLLKLHFGDVLNAARAG